MRMEAPGAGNSDVYRSTTSPSDMFNYTTATAATTTIPHSHSRRFGMQLSPSNILPSPLSAILEYSGIIRSRSSSSLSDSNTNATTTTNASPLSNATGTGLSRANRDHLHSRLHESSGAAHLLQSNVSTSTAGGDGEVSIRIIGAGEQDHLDRVVTTPSPSPAVVVVRDANSPTHVEGLSSNASAVSLEGLNRGGEVGVADGLTHHTGAAADTEAGDGVGSTNRDSPYQRYDIQQAAKWIEQVLPFSLLLLVVFIRQHLQGFFVTIWTAAVMFKSNDILRKQTALKGERKVSVLIGISIVFTLHVVMVYWWYQSDDLLYPFVMLPPRSIPPFWHALFIIMVNDTLVRQAAMVLKCMILMYYKNSRGRSYRKQGQMLTLIEYLLLLYRSLLPAPVWYRFFLNKEYGSLFSSLMTGLYLTFKLTSVVEKVQCFLTSLKALSRKEIHYGAYATSEQVNAVGDLCAICQEKMHAPILLRCKHIFCEDCVSEWFERERTCPLCRALVKLADLRSFGDGSTSLFFQFF